eukprot:gene11856-20177_t
METDTTLKYTCRCGEKVHYWSNVGALKNHITQKHFKKHTSQESVSQTSQDS